jgi:pimeloyl-ACP methyl ester carboxylesterase
VLDVGVVEVGPGHGQAVLLLHGWPYDVHSFEKVAPALVDAGYRVVVPYLRGYGTTPSSRSTRIATDSRRLSRSTRSR